MLTRLEADGFKNLLGFSVDFGPYTCIAGPNAAGKSNVFDAIEFLALLADHTFMEAAQRLRSIGPRGGDPKSLFWDDDMDSTVRDMRLAAELIVPNEVEDDFGRVVSPTTSYLRYEIALRYHPGERGSRSQPGRVSLLSESLRHINRGDAPGKLTWPHSKKLFRDKVILGRRSGIAYISTSVDGVVSVHQDGGSRGQPRTSPAERAPRTVVSTTTTSDDPTILAARREMQQWRLLALEPSAMRAPDGFADPSRIGTNGAHLAATLNRIGGRDEHLYAKVAADAAALTDVREVAIDLDPHRELLTLQARLGDGPLLPARALSDGTLRFLALCLIGADSEFGGLLCMEEPENGIHPGRINAMVDLVRDLAVDPELAPGPENPLRQVIVNTHSPHFVQFQHIDDLLLALPTAVRRNGAECTTLRLLPMAGSWRAQTVAQTATKGSIVEYLRMPPDRELRLELGLADEAV